ncbi:MAG TPA: L-seryl-tRNA(Sec) selenium transferase [Gammaproteobacteria bacterium]
MTAHSARPGSMSQDLLRQLPAVDKWLASEHGMALCAEYSRAEVVDVMRAHLARIRSDVQNGATELPPLASEEYFALLRADLIAGRQDSLRRCINATGIIIHTNLGRAPLAPEALQAIERVSLGYSNLEYDLADGRRGSRNQHVESLLARLTGAESALVVNNCAAAVVLVLRALARDGEIVVSRGELIEIGGSFRMPDVIAESGAWMVEVGTTNRTTIEDYAAALTDRSRVLLASHPSNYRIVGFTAKPALAELAELARRKNLLFVQDLGSGALIDLGGAGVPSDPTVSASVAQGADLVTFSGDKMLGGPQAGIIVGRAELIAALKRNPLSRALRIDKLSLAALAATLRLYMPPNDPLERIPVLRMITESKESVGRRAARLLKQLREVPALEASLADDVSYAGGGALPMNEIPTKVIRLKARGATAAELAQRFRAGDPPVIGRIVDETFTVDLRTVSTSEMADLAAAVRRVAG